MELELHYILRTLGITRNYRGYRLTIFAVKLVLEDESRLYSIIREIYDVVGAATGCTGWSVEKNIRTVVFRAWKVNRSFLSKLAGYPLTAPPSVSQFIEMLTAYLQRVQERKQGLRDAR